MRMRLVLTLCVLLATLTFAPPASAATAADQLAALIAELQNAPIGPGNSFLAKLEAAAHSLDRDTPAACSQLGAFESEVRAQVGKKVTQAQADALLAESGAIKSAAGCPGAEGDITQPTMIDAHLIDNFGSSDFFEAGDSFSLTFSETMNGVTTGVVTVQDQDGTLAQITCGTGATCAWNAAVTTVTVTLTASPAIIAFGTTPGLQIPFNIVAFAEVQDLHGNPINVLGSSDRLVDYA